MGEHNQSVLLACLTKVELLTLGSQILIVLLYYDLVTEINGGLLAM